MTEDKKLQLLKSKAKKVAAGLVEMHPDAACALKAKTSLQLLIATILSAQCTDIKVNKVMPFLIKKYKNVNAFAGAEQSDLEDIIRSLGLFRNKAKNIILCCRKLLKDYGGRVPAELEELVTLPGVGRKTANCVLVNAFGKPGLMTDTHFCRIVRRLGLSENKKPEKIESDLALLLPSGYWGDFSHQIIIHGRKICAARKPRCGECKLREICNYFSEMSVKDLP